MIEQSDKEYFYSGSFFLCISLLLTIALFIPPDGLFQAEAAESFISVKEEYTDNLYLEEENKKDEYVTIMEAGIKLPAKSERRGLAGEYLGRALFHKNYPQEDRTEHNGNVEAKFGFGKRDTFSLRLNEQRYYEVKDIRESEAPKNLSQIEIFDATTSLKLLLARGAFDMGYRYVEKRYKDPEFSNSYDWQGYIEFDQKIGRRVSTIFGYSYLSRNFKNKETGYRSEDYDEHEGDIGLRLDMPLDFNGQLMYGHIWRSYDQGKNSEYSTFEGNLEWMISRMMNAGLSYGVGRYEEVGEDIYTSEEEYRRWSGETKIKLGRRHGLSAGYGEGFYQGLDGRIYKRNNSNIGVTHDFRERIKLTYGGYYIKDTYRNISRKDVVKGVDADCRTSFTKRIILALSGNYEEKVFDPEGYRDYYFKGTVGLLYNISRNFSSGIDYTHIKNTSTAHDREYINNRYSIQLTARF